MVKKVRSKEAKIHEHKKYYRQCAAGVRSGLKLIFICTFTSIGLWFLYPNLLKLGLWATAFFIMATILEFVFMKKHERAIDKLNETT